MLKKLFGKSKQKEELECVKVVQVTPQDSEIIEEWCREVPNSFRDMHFVGAYKTNDDKFAWNLDFSAGEFIREEPFVSLLSETIHKSICGVEGVIEAAQDDRERFVIDGNPSGEVLVHEVSNAIDKFMECHLSEWEKAVKA